MDIPGCRPDHHSFQWHQPRDTKLLSVRGQFRTSHPNPIYPQILSCEDTGSQIQTLGESNFSTIRQNSNHHYQGKRWEARPSRRLLLEQRWEETTQWFSD